MKKFYVITVVCGIFASFLMLSCSNIANGSRSLAKAVATAAKTVINFIAKPYTISGTIKYTYGNQQFPAYGVKVKNVTLGGLASNTDASGSFNLGARTDSAGLCFLWLDYENDACKLTNFLGVTASTLVKTALPSYLQNVTITSGSDYANAKMAICSDMLSRYNDEAKRHGKIPQAYVWTTEFGDGTSSAPSFRVMGSSLLPDIILTGVSSKSGSQYLGTIQTLHHEYTHFLHCVYAANKNNFWDNVVLSEIGCTIANATVGLINKIFGSNFKTGYAGSYNFDNPYVYFAENYAEWYSYVGCYGKGPVGKKASPNKGYGTYFNRDIVFTNQEIFINLVQLLNMYGNANSADIIVSLVDKYDITTFNELYTALIKEFPNLKTQINETFRQHYKPYGSKPGNVVNPQ